MSLPVLLLLSLWTVPCGGCDFDWEVAKNIKSTIDSNPTGFRRVFPKDYNVVHRYTQSVLCDTDPCCVFRAAVVLRDSWEKLHKNLWEEHLNRSFILDLEHALDTIISKNRNAMLFQEEMDWSHFPPSPSSPEELLQLTSEFIARWLQVGCSPSIRTCALPTLPTLPPAMVREDFPPSRARLLTTRAVSSTEQKEEEEHKEEEEEEVLDEKNDGEQEKAEEQVKIEEEVMEKKEEEEEEQSPHRRMDSTRRPPSSRGPPLLSTPVWSPLLFRLYWWLLP